MTLQGHGVVSRRWRVAGSAEASRLRNGTRLPRLVLRLPSPWSDPDNGRRATRLRPVLWGYHFRPALSFGLLGGVFRLIAERPPQLAYSDLLRSLAHASLVHPCWLRPLCSSQLSPGINATMSRSDPSPPHRARHNPWHRGSGRDIGPGRSRRGLPRSRTSLFPPSQRQSRDGSPVQGFDILGRLAHPCRRIAFTFVPG